MAETVNPYAPPRAHVEDVAAPVVSDAHAIRAEHIKREAAIRSIGTLYYFCGALLCLVPIASMFFPNQLFSDGVSFLVVTVLCVGFGVLSFFVATGLRRLRPWARKTSIGMAAIGLIRFPTGTVVNGYILYLLLSKKGKRIFESDYPDIVAATADIKNRMSVLTWVAVGVLILVLIGIAAMSAARI